MRRLTCIAASVAVLAVLALPAGAAPTTEKTLGERIHDTWNVVLQLIAIGPSIDIEDDNPRPPVESITGSQDGGGGMDPAG